MIILGIDPGLQKTGWGVISVQGNALRYIGSGLIKTDAQQDIAQRLSVLHQGLQEVIEKFKPEMAAVEETFVNKNPASALKLGQARGVALCVPALFGLDVAEYSANKVKKSVVGSGHAAKAQMGMMIRTLLPACGSISEDEADSLAVAITHAHYRNWNALKAKIAS
jgi:crossover junction endodeoxyribonuclease RuvC